MKKQLVVMKTKLFPPKVKETMLRRAKLTQKMKAIPSYPLTLVHAGAGYGKSTALSLYVNDENVSCCWYSISSSDDDILPFIIYLVSSIQTVVPAFGTDITEFIKEMDPYIREEELHTLCSLFINEFLLVDEEVIVILDDYHQIEHSYNINRWMEILLEHMPERMHLIVSSRSRPLWQPLTRMKVSNHLLEITKDDLVLSKEEIELLLCDFYDISLNDDELEEIVSLTEGWVIALGMIAQQVPEQMNLDMYLKKTSASLNDLFHYLAKEVFDKQPTMIQQFLEQTSVFDEIDEEICDQVLGMTGTQSMLLQLTDKNLFIQRIGERQYRYHALFREFLEEQLRKSQPQNYRILHEACARFFERRKQWEVALIHYEKTNHMQAIASLLNQYGLKMLESGKLESLFERLQKIPEKEKDRYFTLWFLEGEVLRYRSLYNEAAASYERAIIGAEKKGNPLEKSRALEGKAKIYLDTIQPYSAERLLYKAIEIREQSDLISEEETGKLYRLLAENLINSGQAMKAEKWIERARAFNANLVDGNLEARLFLRTGRLEEARRILLSSRKKLTHSPSSLPQSHRETDLLLSLIEAFKGNNMESKTLAQEGIQHGIEIQSPFVEAVGWIRMGHAVQLLHKYEGTLAEKCYETALEIMDKLQVERGKAEPLMGLCILYGYRGQYERAMEAGHQALQETERVEDLWLSSLITLSMGIASVSSHRLEDAFNYLEKAETMFNECYDDYGKMLAFFWQAYCYYHQKNEELFKRNMKLFLKQSMLGGYEFIFHNRTILGPRDLQVYAPLLIQAQKHNISTRYVVKLLQDMGLTDVESHPGYTLRIQALGQFKAWLGDKEMEDRDWQRGKAKELLQLFVTFLYQMLPKEEIFQRLWPEQDEKSTARDFKVALNALNNALEPNRKARSAPFFVIREGTTYGLNRNAHIELDTKMFEEWIKLGLEEDGREKAAQCLEKGLHLYKGDYLPERRYDDWCLNERERLLVFFLRASEKLAQLSVRVEDYDKAIYWCEKILEKDRTWEEAYRLLMYCYYRKNNRPFAIKWYRRCCEILNTELGVPPLEPTRHMYEMIIEAEKNVHPM